MLGVRIALRNFKCESNQKRLEPHHMVRVEGHRRVISVDPGYLTGFGEQIYPSKDRGKSRGRITAPLAAHHPLRCARRSHRQIFSPPVSRNEKGQKVTDRQRQNADSAPTPTQDCTTSRVQSLCSTADCTFFQAFLVFSSIFSRCSVVYFGVDA